MEHSLTATPRHIIMDEKTVLILILMEHSLTLFHLNFLLQRFRLNPYFNGTLSDTYGSKTGAVAVSLNPYFNGTLSDGCLSNIVWNCLRLNPYFNGTLSDL